MTVETDGQHYDDDSPSYDAQALALAPHQLLTAFPGLNVCAPMVRYSKLPFRDLVSRYDTHITTTPMILAKEFSRSQTARDSDMTTNQYERGTYDLTPGVEEASLSAQRLISKDNEKAREAQSEQEKQDKRTVRVRGGLVAQFASSTPKSLADACELVAGTVDGVDLNCGCWAYQEELGSFLLGKPETVRDMVRAVKDRVGQDYCVSVKIRVDDDLRLTDTLVRNALHAGASILSIHGRTRLQSSASHPVDLDAIRFAVDAANSCGFRTSWGSKGGAASQFADGGSGGLVPCVANGDIWTLAEAIEWRRHTGTKGAMSARGLLANPALFAGYDSTPPEAVNLFTSLATAWSLPTALTHRHLSYMLESSFESRQEAIHFNSLNGMAAITDWLGEGGYLCTPHTSPIAGLFGLSQKQRFSSVREMEAGFGL